MPKRTNIANNNSTLQTETTRLQLEAVNHIETALAEYRQGAIGWKKLLYQLTHELTLAINIHERVARAHPSVFLTDL